VHSDTADIEIHTAEGDKVSIQYDVTRTKRSYVRINNRRMPGLEDSLKVESKLNIEVEGELDENEKAAIDAFKKELTAILDDHFSTNNQKPGDPVGLALERYEPLKNYTLSFASSRQTTWASAIYYGKSIPPDELTIEQSRTNTAKGKIEQGSQTLAMDHVSQTTLQETELDVDYSLNPRIGQKAIHLQGDKPTTESRERHEMAMVQSGYQEIGTSKKMAESFGHFLQTGPVNAAKLAAAARSVFVDHGSTFLRRFPFRLGELQFLEKDFLAQLDNLVAQGQDSDQSQTPPLLDAIV